MNPVKVGICGLGTVGGGTFNVLKRNAEGQTVIIVTHEPDIAAHCRRAVRLADGKVLSDIVNTERLAFRSRESTHV